MSSTMVVVRPAVFHYIITHYVSLQESGKKNRERGSMAAMAQSCASFAMLLVTECKQRTTQERELPLAGTDFPDLFRHVMNV